MSEDWKAGDIAIGVHASRCLFGPHEDDATFMVGRICRVNGVSVRDYDHGDQLLTLALGVVGESGEDAWCAGCFRKLNDGEDDAELSARIKSCQPVKQDA